MRITKPAFHFLAALLAIAAHCFLPKLAHAQGSTGNTASAVSIEATNPIAEETSFPYRRMALRGLFTITRTGSTESPLSVFVHYGGTATPDLDYPSLPWLVTIPAGTNRIEIEVVPKPDGLAEPIETIEATLSECPPVTDPPMGIPCYLVNIDPAHAAARAFIRDDGVTTATLQITAPKDMAEFTPGTPIDINATAIDLAGAITRVAFLDGDKQIGESTVNFFRTPDPGTPVFHQFQWQGAAAGLHTLTAHATGADGNAITSAPVQITVGVGVPVVSIAATRPHTAEPCPTCRIAPGLFTISRTGPTENGLTVFLATHGTATPGDDYDALPNSIEIPAGQESVDLHVMPKEDHLPEGDETVLVELQPDPSLGPIERYRVDPNHREAKVIIHDNGLATATLEITAPKDGSEFAEGTPITIKATAIDWSAAITHVAFFDGEKQIGDSTVSFFREPDPGTPVLHEFLWKSAAAGPHTLTARTITAAGIAIASLPVHITVVGSVPVVSIAASQPHTSEPCPDCAIEPAAFTITRTGPTDSGLTVFLTTHGSATPGDDYQPLPNSIEIPAGHKSVDLLVMPKDDNLKERTETIIATLQPDPSMGPLERYRVNPHHREATITISDDASPVVPFVTIRATDAFAREGENPPNTAAFEVRRKGDTTSALTVVLAFGGPAVNGVDYEALPNEVTIPAGSHSAGIIVTPIDDKALEKLETVSIELVIPPMAQMELPSPPPYFVGHPRHAAAIIVDNHTPRPPCLHLPNGVFNLCVPVDPAHCYRVEASPDLQHWTPICTLPANEGMAHYVDLDTPGLPRNFYRLIPVPCDAEQ